ncbi:MAG: SDR family NAD-dependent epimerase/dehydratase, partial [Terriglobales bacterium]
DCPDPYPVNLGNPREIPILEFAKIVAQLAGAPENIEFLPLPQDDPKRRCPDIARARQLLGWEPRVALEEGLRRTMAAFQAAASAL